MLNASGHEACPQRISSQDWVQKQGMAQCK